jgi:putative endonuclease
MVKFGILYNIDYRPEVHKSPSGYYGQILEQVQLLEDTAEIGAAIAREKELKGWRHSKKIAPIQKVNPQWSDLSRDLIQ